MTDLHDRFEQASADVKDLTSRPDDDTMLRLYGLYKQGSVGDVTGKRPGRLNLVARAKHDAWAAQRGPTQQDAQQAYVELVERLRDGAG